MAPPRGPETWGSPLRGRGGQESRPQGVGTPSGGAPPTRPDKRPGGGGGSQDTANHAPTPRGPDRRHAGSLEALRVTGPEAVASWCSDSPRWARDCMIRKMTHRRIMAAVLCKLVLL